MAWTVAMVRGVAPEFSTIGDPEVTTFIGYAALQHNSVIFGGRSDYAGAILTAHLLALAHPELSQGAPLMSERVGEVAVTRALQQFKATALSLTRHGIEYMRQITLNRQSFAVI